MPDISSVGPNSTGPLERAATSSNVRRDAPSPTQLSAPPDRPGDRVEVSDHARYLDQLRRLPPARVERVAQVKAQIAEGTYLTEARLDGALDSLLEDLVG